jgi:predicted nucleotidyltransferase
MNSLPEGIKERIVPVLLEHDVAHASIFGSYARGTQGENSDIDILVEFRGAKSLLDLVGLRLDLQDATGLSVDVVTYRALNHRIRERVLQEQVVIL